MFVQSPFSLKGHIVKTAITVAKNFSIFLAFCTLAGLWGVYFFGACFTKERARFSGTFMKRLGDIFTTTVRYIKWKANRLLGEPIFSLAA